MDFGVGLTKSRSMRVKSSAALSHTNRFGRAHTGAPRRLRNLGLALLVLAACLWGSRRVAAACPTRRMQQTQPGETLFAGNVDSSLSPPRLLWTSTRWPVMACL